MTAMTAPFNAPVTVTTLSDSAEDRQAAMELSIMMAMNPGQKIIMPEVLVGTTNVNGAKNETTVIMPEPEAQPEETIAEVELTEGEKIVADLRDENVIFEVGSDLGEAIAITETPEGQTWVTFRTLDNGVEYVNIEKVETEISETALIEILAAWDRVTAKGLRSLVAA